MAKTSSPSALRAFWAMTLCVLCLVLVASNVLWLGKVKAERRVAELEDKLQDNNKLVKDMKTKMSSASTQQEAEHNHAASLQERVATLEAQLQAHAAAKSPSAPSAPLAPLKPLPSSSSNPPSKPSSLPAPPPPALPSAAIAAAAPPPPVGAAVEGMVIPVVVLACCRPGYLERTLTTILARLPTTGPDTFEVWVSQDGPHEGVKKLVAEKFPQVHYMQHLDASPLRKTSPSEQDSYYKIARHYAWCFNHVFSEPRFSYAIVLEDDLEVAPDFFDYMAAGARLLGRDPSLWTVSAWNDNGLKQFSMDAGKVLRSDFFGGLGWLLSRKLWEELGPKWPKAYWDDWMREPPQRRGRAIIRPEISRTVTFGKEGSSMGQFFDSHLSKMVLNTEAQPFAQQDWSYLVKSNYDAPFLAGVNSAQIIDVNEALQAQGSKKILYKDHPSFTRIAQKLGIMTDEKAGVPRTAYLGVVTLSRPGLTLYVAPASGAPYYKQEV